MEDVTDVGLSGSSVKRVRKKSAKVREMEEAEAFEKKLFKSPPKSSMAPVTSPGGALVAMPATKKNRSKPVSAPKKITHTEDIPQSEVPSEFLNSSNVSFLSPPKQEAGTEEPLDVPVSLSNHSKPVLTPTNDIPPKKPKPKKKPKTPKDSAKKDPAKTEKLIPAPVPIPEPVNTLYDTYSSITVKQEDDSGLKIKLCLNSPKDVLEEPMDFQSDDEQPAIWPTYPTPPSTQDQVVVKLKKKKSKKHKTDEPINGDALDGQSSLVSPPTLDKENCSEAAEDAKDTALSVKVENEAPEPIVIKPLKMDPEVDRAQSPLGPSELETQLVIDTDTVKIKRSKSGKKRKRKQPPIVDESVTETKVIKQEQEEVDENDENSEGACPVNLYSNTAAMALKLKTSSEKRGTGSAKERKNKKGKKKKFRRNGPTAYTMFCNNYRSKVVAENPGSDFAQTSKRLGEIWQCLPAKEKMVWKRKARQCLNKMQKEATAKQTAKSVAPVNEDPTRPPPILHRLGKNNASKQNALYRGGRKGISKKIIQPELEDAAAGSSTLLGQLLTSHTQEEEGEEGAMSPPPQPKQLNLTADPTTPCGPIDVAAHLKLLGDSLTTIGTRLQEHRVPIAVQGSLSVLLDSSICAMGALMSLTHQVPELQTIPSSLHSTNLDNIAYIMPGIG